MENGGNKLNMRDVRFDLVCWGISFVLFCVGDFVIIVVREIFWRWVMSVFVICCEGVDLFGDECECFGFGLF